MKIRSWAHKIRAHLFRRLLSGSNRSSDSVHKKCPLLTLSGHSLSIQVSGWFQISLVVAIGFLGRDIKLVFSVATFGNFFTFHPRLCIICISRQAIAFTTSPAPLCNYTTPLTLKSYPVQPKRIMAGCFNREPCHFSRGPGPFHYRIRRRHKNSFWLAANLRYFSKRCFALKKFYRECVFRAGIFNAKARGYDLIWLSNAR